MWRLRGVLLAVASLAAVPSLAAADLANIDRSIAKEPKYQSQNVRYCLLVFGPEAKTRVWLVHDGEALYLDRNGNGDLTDEAEKIAPEAGQFTDASRGVFHFKAGGVSEGELLHKGLEVSFNRLDYAAQRDPALKALLEKDPDARYCSVALDVEVPGWRGDGVGGRVVQFASYDLAGFLILARSPQDAPVVHFRGPLQIAPDEKQSLKPGREKELFLAVGSPGFGSGSTAWVAYEGVVPEGARPTVEIAYPRRPNDDAPLRERYELPNRC